MLNRVLKRRVFGIRKWRITCHVLSISDKNSWDTSTQRCFFTSVPSPRPPNVVYRSYLTNSCRPTLGGQEDNRVLTILTETVVFNHVVTPWTTLLMTRDRCTPQYKLYGYGNGFQLLMDLNRPFSLSYKERYLSDFVDSVSCVPDADDFQKVQNNSMDASRRT